MQLREPHQNLADAIPEMILLPHAPETRPLRHQPLQFLRGWSVEENSGLRSSKAARLQA